MKLKWLSAIMLICALEAFPATTITDVAVQQRYPWNGKVDIVFNIESTRVENPIRISALDTLQGVSIPVVTLSDEENHQFVQPVTAKQGLNHFVWDASADAPKGFNSNSVAISITAGLFANHKQYCVVDLEDNCTVTYLDEIPAGGWSEEYQESKLLLRLIQPGIFIEGPNNDIAGSDGCSRQCTITQPYYFGVYPVTKKQWIGVMGDMANQLVANSSDRMCPNWYDIRGNQLGYNWPVATEVDEETFIGQLRKKSGNNGFDLPTEAQWEYAARAGIPRTAGIRDDAKSPNPWGVYNLGGLEWTIDWSCYNFGQDPAVDPKGPSRGDAMFDKYHMVRGGYGNTGSLNCRCPYKDAQSSISLGNPGGDGGQGEIGFRIILQLRN